MQSSFLRSILCRYENIPSPYRHPTGRYASPAEKLARSQPEARGVTTRSQNSLTPSAEPLPEQPGWKAMKFVSILPLLLENSEAFIEEVVPHELAHLLVWKHFGRIAPHGKEWKWMMESVLARSRPPYASVRTAIRAPQHLPLPLQVPEHQLTVRRHNRRQFVAKPSSLCSLRRTAGCEITT